MSANEVKNHYGLRGRSFQHKNLHIIFRSLRSSKDTLFQHHLPEPTGKKKYALGAKQMQKILPGHRGYK